MGQQALGPSARAVLCESHLFRITGCVAQVFYQPLTEYSSWTLSGSSESLNKTQEVLFIQQYFWVWGGYRPL